VGLEKLIVTQGVEKFPAFYGTRSLMTVFSIMCRWILPILGHLNSFHYMFI